MNRVSMVLAGAAMLFAVQSATASDDVSSDIAEMRELVQELKQKVDAQEEQLEHQGQLLEQAQDVARKHQDEGTKSGLDDFLDQIEVGGHIAGSYWYDLDDPSGTYGGAGLNNGEIGTMPFHPDHNQFTVDQLVLSIGKGTNEESPAGFQFDFLFGNAANFLGQGTGFELDGSGISTSFGRLDNAAIEGDEPLGRRFTAADSTSDFYIAQAYIEYMCNCFGPEVTFQLGKRMTDVGAEVYMSGANHNISIGNVYTFLQPVDHLGLWATTDLGPVEFTLGIMNEGGSGISSPDLNKEKSYEASAFVGNDRMNVRTTFIYGADVSPFGINEDEDDYFDDLDNPNSVRTGTADVTAWFNPTDGLSTWANYTATYIEGTRAFAHGVALAGRVQVLEKAGVALRGEYVKFQVPRDMEISDSGFDFELFDGTSTSAELYSITGTVDYALTDNLTARAEYRWDMLKDRTSGDGFFENDEGFSDNRSVIGAELVYGF